MNTVKLNDKFTISSQIEVYDLPEIKASGFKTIICNRPDKEEYNQVTFSEIKEEAEKIGISCFHIPIYHDSDPVEIVREYKRLDKEFKSPILAYCKSGGRSSFMIDLISG